MALLALGINHHTSPLAVREQLAFDLEQLTQALHDLRRSQGVSEAAILSTCNRTELYCAAHSAESVAAWLAHYHRVAPDSLAPHLYTHFDADAVRHAFRVASGLDSMVIGEPQILGQMKDAMRIAQAAGCVGSTLHQLFQDAFATAKAVRSGTAIGTNIVSMAAATVHLAARIFERIAEQKILFVGAGEMIERCATHFAAQGAPSMVIANRSSARAEQLAQRVGGSALRLDAIAERLGEFDIVISCTASRLPIIGLGMVERAIKTRRHRPMFMVDLAVPRDIEGEVAALDDVFLYTLDDLAQVVQSGLASRQAAVLNAEAMISERVNAFLRWQQTRTAIPLLRSLRDAAEQARAQELARALKLLTAGNPPEQVLEQMSQRLCNKLLHIPTHALKQANTDPEQFKQQLHQLLQNAEPSEITALPKPPAHRREHE
ncbi:MAG: glutamyl-tRNA reductase [Pseudomonadota bacterium]